MAGASQLPGRALIEKIRKSRITLWPVRPTDPERVALYTFLQQSHLKPVKRISVKFDPFDPDSKSIREFLYHVNGYKLRLTNPDCTVRQQVVCDRSEPIIDVDLDNGQKLIFKTRRLKAHEIVEQFNRVVHKVYKPPLDVDDLKF